MYSLIKNSAQQDYLPELYPIISQIFMGNPGDGGESHSTAKNLLISPTRKIPFNKFTLFAIKSVIPFPSNSNFHLITLYKLHLQLQSLLLHHFFFLFTSDCMYSHVMLILINQCLLNVLFSMTKALNSQSSPKQNLYSPHLLMLFGKPCLP